MRYPFHEWQKDFGDLAAAIQLRNALYRDAAECHAEYAHEEAAFLLDMAEAAEAGAAKMVEDLK